MIFINKKGFLLHLTFDCHTLYMHICVLKLIKAYFWSFKSSWSNEIDPRMTAVSERCYPRILSNSKKDIPWFDLCLWIFILTQCHNTTIDMSSSRRFWAHAGIYGMGPRRNFAKFSCDTQCMHFSSVFKGGYRGRGALPPSPQF